MGILLLTFGIVLLLILSIQNSKYKSKRVRIIHQENEKISGLYMVLYRVISKNFITRRQVNNIRSRIEMVEASSERIIRKKTVRVFVLISLVIGLLLVAMISVTKQVMMIGIFCLVLWFLSETLVDFYVTRMKNRLLAQQVKLNDLIRHKYYETKMVDEAIYLASQSLDPDHHDIGLQAQKIYDVLMAKDVEKEMVTYNELAPNKFLKMLIGLAYITMEYGDHQMDGSSVFMRNLSDLSSEIRIELSKRERLNYALRSLNIIVLAPLFFITPIKDWASHYFMPLKLFYESQIGFILEVVTITIIFLCFILLRRLQKFDDMQKATYHKRSFEQKLYDKGLHHLIDWLKPKQHKGHYFKLKRELKMVASHISVEAYTTRKLLAFLTGLAFATTLFLALHYNTSHQILTGPTLPEQFLGGQLSQEEQETALEITRQDVKYLSQLVPEAEEVDIIKWLVGQGVGNEEAKVIAKRLISKQVILMDQYLKWWEVAIIIIVGLISYQLPYLYLKFQQKVMRIDIEDEISGFSAIILMLMYHERLSVIEVLEWLELFSNTFKEAIGDCINNSAAGLTEALEELRDVSDEERFLRIMDSLILASEEITIRQAFDELQAEKGHYLEQRKEVNMRVIEKKINLGRMFGFLPLYGLIMIYMIVPMITTSMADMNTYFSQLKQ